MPVKIARDKRSSDVNGARPRRVATRLRAVSPLLASAWLAVFLALAPAQSTLADVPVPSHQSNPSGDGDVEPTILGMTYTQAALASAAVVGGALVINSFVGANLGTTLAVLYVGHLIVEAGIVALAAGGSLGLSWWSDDPGSGAALF
ncbi:MAG: hypothetical protein ACO37B_07350 [Arenicellales bacterium]